MLWATFYVLLAQLIVYPSLLMSRSLIAVCLLLLFSFFSLNSFPLLYFFVPVDVEPLVGIVTEGKNACVMAYGDATAGM